MPVYDYICQNCHKRFEVFLTYQEYGLRAVACTHCGSSDVRRRVPRVRLQLLEDDPQALGRMMRKMGREMGEEMPAEFDEVVDRLEKGQSPDEIESAMPDLAGLGDDDHAGHDHSFDD